MGTPLVIRQMEGLMQLGIRHFFLNGHHLQYRLRSVVEYYFYARKNLRDITFTFLEEEPILGTGGALYQARDMIQEEHFFLINSDILHDIDLVPPACFHLDRKPLATLIVKRTNDPDWKKVAVNSKGEIMVLGSAVLKEESAPLQFGFTGIHILNQRIFDYCTEKKYQCINRDIYPAACSRGETILAFETDRYWIDVGDLTGYSQAHKDILIKKIVP